MNDKINAQLRLYRQKEQLKKDILKKRLVLEKELKNEIQQELATELASRTKQEMPAATPAKDEEIKTPTKATASPNKKRYDIEHLTAITVEFLEVNFLPLRILQVLRRICKQRTNGHKTSENN